ncbi:MAG: UDP-N-acetylmuramoyl-L-alanyl-D-glutamate--2,6-diaminopimelate ligase [Terrimicrobiaceae bacterium]
MSVPLAQLLAGSGVQLSSSESETPIDGISYDSRTASPGDLFFALPGLKSDGSQFVGDAVQRGAAAVVVSSPVPTCPVPVIRVDDARCLMADASARFYSHPSEALKVIGVTGTNGKTTTAFLCRGILDAAMRRCGLIGTVKYVVGDEEIDAPRTTPESADLQGLLAKMRDNGCKAVAMEVSSHALDQKRVHGIEFDAAVFTNLTQDHLDYHKTMEAYFDAKASLFESLETQKKKGRARAVINADDRYGHLLLERLPKNVPVVTFGLGARADLRATDLRFDANGSQFHLQAKGRSYLVRLPLIGAFNVSNALAALAATAALGIEVRAAVAALANAAQVPGRLERVPARRNFQVFVDYAHTDDALRNVLKTLRELRPSRLIVVVGCGGDRDRAKRPLMASAAESLADWTILTSDNPRTEDPAAILAEMKKGLRHTRHEEILDRAEAIRRAVSKAGPGDIVLIAGKGHETYQEVNGERIPFDDVQVARLAIDSRRVDFGEEAAR